MNAMNYIKTGMTEKEVAAFVDAEYLRLGADGNSFGTDVSFGDDAADPHHMTGDRVLKDNELVLIDMGCIMMHPMSIRTSSLSFNTLSPVM